MTEVKIDCDVPVPEVQGSCIPLRRAAENLQIGQSFLCPPEVTAGSAASIAYSASCKFRDRKYTRRKTPEGHRIWRVK